MEINKNNSVVMGVCHFCEHHGPCVIFHTQLGGFRDDSEGSTGTITSKNQIPSSSNTNCTVKHLDILAGALFSSNFPV